VHFLTEDIALLCLGGKDVGTEAESACRRREALGDNTTKSLSSYPTMSALAGTLYALRLPG
jgi:hypothetical protein